MEGQGGSSSDWWAVPVGLVVGTHHRVRWYTLTNGRGEDRRFFFYWLQFQRETREIDKGGGGGGGGGWGSEGGGREREREGGERDGQSDRQKASNLVFYIQSTISVTSGRKREEGDKERQTDRQPGGERDREREGERETH